MYRVYDNKEKRWVREGIYLSPNNDLSTSKKALFGIEKLSLVSDHRYVYHKDIGLPDKNNHLIFEGDICRSEKLNIVGLISYIESNASYCFLDYDNSMWYPLGTEVCKELEIIGNIFDNSDLLMNGE